MSVFANTQCLLCHLERIIKGEICAHLHLQKVVCEAFLCHFQLALYIQMRYAIRDHQRQDT